MEETEKPSISEGHTEPSKVPTQWHTENVVPVGWMKQFEYFISLAQCVRDVPGAFVECGLGEGNTFTMLAFLIGNNGWASTRKLWGYDSFEGWPEPTAYDDSPRKPKKGEWKVHEEMVKRVLDNSGILDEFPDLNINIVKGFVGDTLPDYPKDEPIAFLHIDLDLYPGYRDALDNLFPLVSPNGIIALDEYKEYHNTPEYGFGTIEKWPGCTWAVNEYLATNGRLEKPVYHPQTRKYFIQKSNL